MRNFRGVKQILKYLSLGFVLIFESALAAPLPFTSRQPIQMDVRDVPVAKLLFDIFSEQGVPLVVSETLPGSFTGRFNARPARIVDDIVKQFGLVYYYDGNAVFVTHVSETASAMIWLEPGDLSRVLHFVDVLKLGDARFTLRASPEDGYLLVAGPPRYVRRMREVVDSVKSSPQSLLRHLQTKVFRLKYASAADSTAAGAAGRDTEVVQQGVASVLARLMGVEAVGVSGATARNTNQTSRRALGALDSNRRDDTRRAALDNSRDPSGKDLPNSTANPPAAPRPRSAGGMPELPADSAPVRGGGTPPPALKVGKYPQDTSRAEENGGLGTAEGAYYSGPVVMAEPRLNAVIVRDEPRRMAIYEDLIAELDVAPQMVEIEATIIDIDSNQLEQLGVDLKIETSNLSILGSAAGRAGVLGNNQPPTVGGSGFVAATMLGSAGNSLVARVTALSQTGDARIVSRPRIVTMNNVGAIITNTKEFNIKVAGERQADLFSVSYGLDMQVTPSVVGDSKLPEFRLLVQIQDGNSQVASVDGIPVITRSTLNTQSLIRQGDSLLIGGYVVDEVSSGQDKVPFLSDIPVIGWLFGERRNSRRRTERLFLITPRLVDRDSAAKTAAAIRASESISIQDGEGLELKLTRQLVLRPLP